MLAQKIYAASDMFLMPSRYEPCGLGQLIAMRYGSVPIVRRTGGLQDTVLDYDADSGSGSGFVFWHYSADDLAGAVSRAVNVYNDKSAWNSLVVNEMQRDFSWNRSAAQYTELYMEALARKGRLERPA